MPRKAQVFPANQLLRVLRGEVVLEEFLDEGEFVDVMEAARWRLIRVFAQARTAPQKRVTPGYILGLDEKLTSLAQYVQAEMNERAQKKIYDASDLPPGYRQLDSRRQRLVVRAVRFELFMRLVTLMRESNDLWYMEGEWLVPQSVVDEYLLRIKCAKASFRNDRSFHGRPRRDRDRMRQLRFAAGTSTGM